MSTHPYRPHDPAGCRADARDAVEWADQAAIMYHARRVRGETPMKARKSTELSLRDCHVDRTIAKMAAALAWAYVERR